MIVQRFNLNLIPNQSPVIVHVNQYDTGTGRLIATLYEGNEPYSPNGTAVIQGTKPDGHGFQYTATLDGNVVTADLTEQMAPVAGDVRTQIVVTESSGVTGTFAFIMRVQPSALPNDTDMSESDYQYIEEAIREAQEAVQTAQEATETAQEAVERAQEAITETQENAEDSEAWAQGTRGGIPVGPTDPTYEHNAEYWAQYAERYAQGGLHYKGSILFANIPTTGMREGDMYDITDDFTTDSRFTEGAGIEVKGGTNIAWNSDNKWDILALPYIPKTTFNGRSGSILPMAGDYDSKKILLTSALHIGGETQSNVQEALEALSDDGVKSFNGRSGSVLPMAGDYDSEKILLASVLHIGGETQDNAQEALEALEGNKAEKVDNAIADNFAGLDADGNLKDSGKKASDFATPSDIAGQQTLLKDTVGWTGKNRAYSQTNNAVIAHIENGITYDVSWTGSATVTLKKNSASGATITSGSTSPLSFTADADYELYFGSSATVTNIMVKDSRITDPTYEPYHESVEVMYEEEMHGVNLLENKATSQTIYGVTFTVNADGSVKVNGTASSNVNVDIYSVADAFRPPIGRYIISRGGATRSNVQLFVNKYNGTNRVSQVTNLLGTNEFEFDVDYDGYDRLHIGLWVDNGTTVSNLMLYPMLRKADIEDGTYRPYNPQAIQNQLNAQGVLGAKNLLKNTYPSQTVSGVTITHNSDDSLSFSGTATAQIVVIIKRLIGTLTAGQKYILSGIKGGSNSTYFMTYNDGSNNPYYINLYDGDGEFIAVDESTYTQTYVGLYIRSGQNMTGITINPMIRLASDPDDTYQPYAMTNRELTESKMTYADNGVLGAKNLLENVATSGTSNGISYTVNSDKSISFAGTTTATSYFPISKDVSTNKFLKDGNYILSTNTPLPTGTELWLNGYVNGAYYNHVATMTAGMKEVAFTVTPNLTGLKLYIQIPHVSGGRVVSSTIIYPMIRLASDPDDTYQPYAMTNRELTEKVFDKGRLTSADDLDDIKETGIYGISTSPANAPESISYCTLMVKANSAADIKQIIFNSTGASGAIYIRTYGGSPLSWKSWYKFTGTVVS